MECFNGGARRTCALVIYDYCYGARSARLELFKWTRRICSCCWRHLLIHFNWNFFKNEKENCCDLPVGPGEQRVKVFFFNIFIPKYFPRFVIVQCPGAAQIPRVAKSEGLCLFFEKRVNLFIGRFFGCFTFSWGDSLKFVRKLGNWRRSVKQLLNCTAGSEQQNIFWV